jgi:DtxR family transcriptional regulator, Mn-dependent transcriptional regulator
MNGTAIGSDWHWAVLVFLLAGLWLRTALRLRRATSEAQPLASESVHRSVEGEDALKAAYGLQERGSAWDAEELAGCMGLPGAMAGGIAGALVRFGWAEKDAQGKMRLTDVGEARARELIRAHRLWEQYLVKREGMPLEAVHAEAHRREHEMSSEELERLDEVLGHPAWDPHGHIIPAPGSPVPSSQARSLLEEGVPGRRLRIACLDDEPAALLAQLVALGLKPGADLEVLEQESRVLRVRLDGNVIPLASAAARHVDCGARHRSCPCRWGNCRWVRQARVVEIAGSGKHQRRMLDMGFVPGAEVTTVRKAPLGDPIEYRIKGTAVALRSKDADTILVEELGDEMTNESSWAWLATPTWARAPSLTPSPAAGSTSATGRARRLSERRGAFTMVSGRFTWWICRARTAWPPNRRRRSWPGTISSQASQMW